MLYFDIEVSLRGIKPKIFRRFLIREEASFKELHDAIQDSLGWEDYHLFEFRGSGRRGELIAGAQMEGDFGERVPNAGKVKLGRYFTGSPKEKCVYTYDFGDSWEHDVVIKGMVELEEELRRRLLSGARAAPREDSGGLPGYERMVEFRATGHDPYGDGDEELKEWLGGWDPEAFDLEATKKSFDRPKTKTVAKQAASKGPSRKRPGKGGGS